MEDIGAIIRKARLEKGMTQEALADYVGVKKSAVAKWENGRVSEIKRSHLSRLSAVLGLKPYELLNIGINDNPEEAANLFADYLLDNDIMKLVSIYSGLNAQKKKQAMDFLVFLSEK